MILRLLLSKHLNEKEVIYVMGNPISKMKTNGGTMEVFNKEDPHFPGYYIELDNNGKSVYIEWDEDKKCFRVFGYSDYEDENYKEFNL